MLELNNCVLMNKKELRDNLVDMMRGVCDEQLVDVAKILMERNVEYIGNNNFRVPHYGEQ